MGDKANPSQMELGEMVRRCLVDLEKDIVPVRVLNPSHCRSSGSILVPGKTFDHHLNNLAQIFQSLRDAYLKLSPEKTTLFQKQVLFLGHVVGGRGI